MSAPRKFDQEFRERAVRLYQERLQHDESKLGARRHVGVLELAAPAVRRGGAPRQLVLVGQGLRGPLTAVPKISEL
jgi:hypothetical protein